MLAPPPVQSTSSEDIVEGRGRTKYLQSLESKLNRLQGTDKRRLKSKDILTALSEARDDHLSHTPTDPLQPATLNVTHSEDSSATNDPWSAQESIGNGHGYITDLSTASDLREGEQRDKVFNIELEELDEEKEVKTGCLPCCGKQKSRKSRVRITSSSLTPEEEGAFLLHCDHLSRQ